ncbi:GntR family transcriptional regulator [Agromyces sp. NPDC060279]|uniref:GntR family transcriptional regulator n=1 Tax=Agromyces sp. NPDC060279 TaxID=3347092 RepID=UPI003655AE81
MRIESTGDTAVDRVFTGLRDDIIAGIRPPGTRIVERAVAEEFEVSRLPVRIALRRLELDGLVDHRARHGTTVRAMSVSEAADLSEVHSALDRLAVRQAAIRRTEADQLRFADHVDAAQRAVDAHDVEQLIAAGVRFRSDVYRATRNAPLLAIHDGTLGRTLRMFTLGEPAAVEPMAHVRSVADALERRDPSAAERAMVEFNEYIRSVRREHVLAQLDDDSATSPRRVRPEDGPSEDEEPAGAGRVTADVRAAILAGELRPGDTVSERILSERHGVGRIPVRHALDALAGEGLITVPTSRVSAKVRDLSREETEDLFDVCVTLDVLATRLAAERRTREEITRLEAELRTVERLAERPMGAAERAELLDRMFAFRRHIYVMAENRALLQVDRMVETRMRLAVARLPITGEALRGQRFLFEAIASRETNLAEAIYLNVFPGRARRARVFGESYGRPGEG